MEQWSILSNILNYVQHSKFNSNRFGENSDISTTYLGRIENKGSQD